MLTHLNDDAIREDLALALQDLANLLRDHVPGCSSASVTVLHEGNARTMSATDPRAVSVDQAQYEADSGPCVDALRRSELVDVGDYDRDPRWPHVSAAAKEEHLRSSLSLPLAEGSDVIGALNLYGATAGAFDQDSTAAAQAFMRPALAVLRHLNQLQLERTRHAEQRAVAATLQRSLLPTLTALPGISAAARYLVSGSAAQVGGDWYDLFALPDGAIGVAIGDVMGHDVAAAAAMGQLRSVLRSYAYEGSSPSVVLDRMDRLVQGFGMAEVATAIYGRLILDRGTGLFLFSNAGHLPPLVSHPGGGTERLDRGTHHLIGALPPGQTTRGEAAVLLPPGSLLLLYTDGLVETRGRSFDAGVEELIQALAAVGEEDSAEQVCEALLARMVTGDPEDDVAILAIRIHRADGQGTAEA